MSDLQRKAWQPLTFGGVARFAHATFARLLLVELCIALVVAGTVIWFASTRYSPVVHEALRQIPEEALLTNGNLSGLESGLLAENKFLSLAVDLEGASESGTADVEVRFCGDGFDVYSLLGYTSFYYPPGDVVIGRSVIEPWWGAWEPAILAGLGVTTLISLVLGWPLLGLIYSPLPKLLAYFADRDLSWQGARRLCCAAQLPAALFASLIIVLYGVQALDLIRFVFFYAVHFLVALAYISVSAFLVQRSPAHQSLKSNPFSHADPEHPES